jgi:single-strand DNA-binding protein
MTQTPTKGDSIWNKVTFTGNLGKDPEMSYTKGGHAVTKFSVAVSQGKDKPAMWLSVETWNKLAEQCNTKLTKGSRIEIDGRLAQDQWEKDGQKRYALKVVAQMVRPLKRDGEKAASGFIEETGESTTPSKDFDELGELDDHPF